MSFTDWLNPIKALAPAKPIPALPVVTPAQIVTEALATKAWVTQGELLDLCKAAGLTINYSGLQSVLKSLHQSGTIAHRFERLECSFPVLVYHFKH